MDRILIDTMWIEAIFSKEEPPYTTLAEAIDNGKIIGVSSVVSITEMIKNLGKKDEERMEITIRELKSSEIILVNVTQKIAERAGQLRLRYDIPTIDSLIAATGIVENIGKILTEDTRHFGPIKNHLKITTIQQALKAAR